MGHELGDLVPQSLCSRTLASKPIRRAIINCRRVLESSKHAAQEDGLRSISHMRNVHGSLAASSLKAAAGRSSVGWKGAK